MHKEEELGNHHFVAIIVIIDTGKNHPWMPAPFGERVLGNRIFTESYLTNKLLIPLQREKVLYRRDHLYFSQGIKARSPNKGHTLLTLSVRCKGHSITYAVTSQNTSPKSNKEEATVKSKQSDIPLNDLCSS